MSGNLLLTIVTSAAIGAVVSSLVTLVGQILERAARRRELLLSKAIYLAARRTDTVKDIALKTGVTALLHDDAELAADYFIVLQHLIEKNELPESFKEKLRRASGRSGGGKPEA